MAIASKARRLAGVDTLRAMAAILVVVGHDLHFINELPVELGGGLRLPMFGAGLGAILLLFVAGFMSVYTGWNKFGVPGQSGQYLLRRAARLVPFYWLFTSLWLLTALLMPQLVSQQFPSLVDIVTSYLFIPHQRANGGIYPLLALGWTMNYIFLFDLLTAMVMRLRREWAILAVIGITTGLMLLHSLTFESDASVYFWTGRYLILYTGGAILSYVYKTRLEGAERLRVNGWISSAALLASAVFASRYLHGPFSFEFTPQFIALLPVIAAMGTVAVLTRETGAGIVQWLRDTIAAMSYSVYLTHPFALGLVIVIWKRVRLYEVCSSWVLFAGGLAGSLILAYVVHRLVEVRVNRLATRLLIGRQDRLQAGATPPPRRTGR